MNSSKSSGEKEKLSSIRERVNLRILELQQRQESASDSSYWRLEFAIRDLQRILAEIELNENEMDLRG